MSGTEESPATHFCAGMIWRRVGGVLQFLVVDYRYQGQTQVKFPGGTNKGRRGEGPPYTLARECHEEVWQETAYGLRSAPPEPVFSERKESRRGQPEFWRYFFLLGDKDWDGDETVFRKEEKTDTGGEILGPPRWESAHTLQGTIFHSHFRAFSAAVQTLLEMC